MSTWITIRGYLLQFVVPIAIRILSDAIAKLKPEVKAKATEFFQGIYDKAVADGDATIQALILSIVAPLFGIDIVKSEGGAGDEELVAESKRLLTEAAAKVEEEDSKAAKDEDPFLPPNFRFPLDAP